MSRHVEGPPGGSPQSKKTARNESWGHSTVRTACPLDCPDSCSLDITVEKGRIVKIEGGHENPVTNGYICAKVRRFAERVYGEDRLLYPAVRKGPKGGGTFTRVSWEEALDLIASRMTEIRDRYTAEAILPFCYGGSNGLLTQDANDAVLFRGFGTSRLARTVCAAPTGAANQLLYGKMPGVVYQDYVHARLIILWGVNPSASGIHLVPYLKQARAAGAKMVVIDPRATSLARQADLHIAPRPGTDLPLALAIHRHLFENGLADVSFLTEHAVGAERLRERASEWTFERAAEVSGVPAATIQQLAELYATTHPALVRCGWGLERNRNGGSAAAAILALPAIGGKFKVRGGGFSMSNSSAWGIKAAKWMDETPEPPTRLVNMNHLGRALTEYDEPPVQMLFVYNCNPLATMPDQQRVLQGLQRDDLFTVVYEQVFTDTCRYADVVLPATTFVENYDIAKGYGPITLQLVQPVIEPVGEARPNAEVFSDLASRLGVGEAEEETDTLMRIASKLGAPGEELMERGAARPPHGGAPVQFVDVFPLTADRKIHLFSDAVDSSAPAGLYGYQADPATPEYPLALISPASEKTVSSTLAELRERAAMLQMHPSDAAARGLATGDPVRVFNAQGEVHCPLAVNPDMRPGIVSLPKGIWRKSTYNGFTSNVLVPDSLTDLGGGACFNDARVQVASLGKH
jgi:anaerobic selenocysteine-containing dehydrogenase